MKTLQHESFSEILLKDSEFFNQLFEGVLEFKEFKKRLEKVSKEQVEELGYPDRHKLIGDLFEIFAEIFFNVLSADNRIGVNGYLPVHSAFDYGVDGYGKGITEQNVTIQVKWRSNPKHELSSIELKDFRGQSYEEFGVKTKSKDMILFTSGAGLHWHTDARVFKGTVREINGKNIAGHVDNNFCFWNDASILIKDTIKSIFG